jgi:hypothetical protein
MYVTCGSTVILFNMIYSATELCDLIITEHDTNHQWRSVIRKKFKWIHKAITKLDKDTFLYVTASFLIVVEHSVIFHFGVFFRFMSSIM